MLGTKETPGLMGSRPLRRGFEIDFEARVDLPAPVCPENQVDASGLTLRSLA